MSYQQEAPIEEQPAAKPVDLAIDARYLAEGYINDDGQRDHKKVAEAIYPLVADAYVGGLSERAGKAVTRGRLIEAAFPSLPSREQWADDELAEQVDRLIRAKVWDLAKADRNGEVQKLVGARTPGLVLCRTQIGTDRVDAVYVTDDLACLREDFAGPLAKKMRAANRRMSLNVSMVGARLPQHAAALDRLYRRANKLALTAGLADTQLMLEAAGDEIDDDGE